MALDDDDVREILRLIDESDLDELRVETEGLSLHVVRSGRRGAARAGAGARADRRGAAIEAPMVGTFYRAPAPGEPPFVEVGSRVEPQTIVCIIEVMKMMNSVHAGVAGTVLEVCSENGALVEYGAPLFRVEA